MSTKLKPYTTYKDSGVPWLGEIPAHWNSLPNRSIFFEVNERDRSDEEMLSVTISRGVIRQQDLLANSSKKDSSNENKKSYKFILPGDITYNKMRAWQGAIGVSSYRGIVSPAYIAMRLRNDHNPEYFHHLFRIPAFAKEAERWSYGITSDQWSLRANDFKQIYTCLPSRVEQDAIVQYINHQERYFQRFIRAKQRLIKLLNEQKQVIIHHAVTRGLDPDVPLKPSGIEWLPESPYHWKSLAIKRVLSQMDYGTSEATTATGSIRVLTMGNIQQGEVILPKGGGLDTVPEILLLHHYDLLFTRTNGNPNLVGKVGIFRGDVTEKISFASYLVRLRVQEHVDARWLHMLLNSAAFWPFARSHALVNLQTNLNSTRYGQFTIPVPPVLEQEQIVDWAEEKSTKLNMSIERARKEIDLIREYRTRLIADVVTGKLDVRDVVLDALPDADVPVDEDDVDEDDVDEDAVEEHADAD